MSDDKLTSAETEDELLDLDGLLDNVKQTQREVTIYPDATLAQRAMELQEQILEERQSTEKPVRALNEKTPETELAEILEKMEKTAIVFTLRALASAEISAIRNHIVATVPIKKNATADETNELRESRQQIAYEHYLSHSVIGIKSGGKSKKGLTSREAAKMRQRLPEAEWVKLIEGFDKTQVATAALEQVMADPTFRWAITDEEE